MSRVESHVFFIISLSVNLADICDFETGLCGLEESSKSEESWTLSTDQSFETAEGPDGDYTYKSQKGDGYRITLVVLNIVVVLSLLNVEV